MNVEECEGCYFLNTQNFDGQVGCSRTGDLLVGKKVCLDKGPLIRMPRIPEELREVIEATQRRWKRERGEFPGIALVK